MKNKIIVSIISALLLTVVFANTFAGSIKVEAATLKLGDTVTIGKFEQDGNSDNGKEAIVWRVLCTNGGKALLLADQILDCRKFHSKEDAPWSGSDMRVWLNGEFYASSFTDKERQYIIKERIANISANETGDKFTEDSVFLLSLSEAMTYSEILSEIDAKPTKVALNKGLFLGKEDYKEIGYWWLRTAGSNVKTIAYVNPDGSIYKAGCVPMYPNFGGVRPAMWIDLAKAELGGNTLTINYTYGDGKKVTIDGKVVSYSAAITEKEKYSITSPTITGYTADKLVVEGVMGKKDIEITVVYKDSAMKNRSIDTPRKQSGEGNVVNLATVKVIGDGVVEYGYSLINDVSTVSNWQTSSIFKDLLGGNKYYFFAKVTGSKVYNDAFSKSNAISISRSSREIDSPQIINFTNSAVAALDVTPYGGGKVTYGIINSTASYTKIKEWKDYPVFTGLTPGVEYCLYAKVAKTTNFDEAYAFTKFTTLKENNGTAIADIKEVNANSIKVKADLLTDVPMYGITDKQDPKSVKDWQKEGTFINLTAGKRYYIYVKLSGVETENFSCVSVVTPSGGRSVMSPEIEKVDGNRIFVKKVSTVGSDSVLFGISKENNANTISGWQIGNIFYNLDVNAEYYVFAKLTNGDAEDDLISDGVLVKTGAEKIEEPVEDDGNSTASPGKQPPEKKPSPKKIFLIVLIVVGVIAGVFGIVAIVYYFIIRKRRNGESEI